MSAKYWQTYKGRGKPIWRRGPHYYPSRIQRDVFLIEPPAFSNTKITGITFSVQGAWGVSIGAGNYSGRYTPPSGFFTKQPDLNGISIGGPFFANPLG